MKNLTWKLIWVLIMKYISSLSTPEKVGNLKNSIIIDGKDSKARPIHI